MKNLDIVQLQELPLDDLQPLLVESRQQGFDFLDRLVQEYLGGSNCFSGANEALFSVYKRPDMVAIGGLSADPYLMEDDAGRIRHVYVLSAWRRQGVGKLLMNRIIEEASSHYRILTLRTFSDGADKFYRALGFRTEPEIYATTHHLLFEGSKNQISA
ncbi:MAG: GNAT family N-acetyltransferase [Anaerolineales bacterium]